LIPKNCHASYQVALVLLRSLVHHFAVDPPCELSGSHVDVTHIMLNSTTLNLNTLK